MTIPPKTIRLAKNTQANFCFAILKIKKMPGKVRKMYLPSVESVGIEITFWVRVSKVKPMAA